MTLRLAHLLNNPLQALANTLFLAQQGGADAQQHIREAAQEVAILSDLVNKLLSVGRGGPTALEKAA